MSTTYEIMTKAEANAAGAAEADTCDLRDESDWHVVNRGVFRCVDGIPVELLGTDGGEPEDQFLYRDWGWVADALNAAHNRGDAAGWGRAVEEFGPR